MEKTVKKRNFKFKKSFPDRNSLPIYKIECELKLEWTNLDIFNDQNNSKKYYLMLL